MVAMRRRPARYVYLCYLQIEISDFFRVKDGEDVVDPIVKMSTSCRR